MSEMYDHLTRRLENTTGLIERTSALINALRRQRIRLECELARLRDPAEEEHF